MIKTWQERLEEMDDGHITTNNDVSLAMQDEIDDLRAALKAQPVQEPEDPQHPQFVAGFKAGTYAGKRRLEMLPADAPKPVFGSVVCGKCGHQQISFLVSEPQPVQSPPLTDAQIEAIQLCRAAGRVSVSQVQRIQCISYNEAQKICQAIVDAGQCGGLELAPSIVRTGAKP